MLISEEKLKSYSIAQLENRIFNFDTSNADKEYFRKMIFKYNKNDGTRQWSKFLWKMIWIRNDKGKFCKYLYFNEYNQKLNIDQLFWEWADRISSEINEALENIKIK
jgi:hypothetical protein